MEFTESNEINKQKQFGAKEKRKTTTNQQQKNSS
jgi:hypothetical protein